SACLLLTALWGKGSGIDCSSSPSGSGFGQGDSRSPEFAFGS
ncbi:hypothetical protein A2U01_0058446, partial [Trifolium medium]|nr:hypothetical protein [Trifolium medium]